MVSDLKMRLPPIGDNIVNISDKCYEEEVCILVMAYLKASNAPLCTFVQCAQKDKYC